MCLAKSIFFQILIVYYFLLAIRKAIADVFLRVFLVNRNWLSSQWPVFSPAIVVLWFCGSKDLWPRPELPPPVVTFGRYGLAPSWTIAVCSRFLSLRLLACDPVSLGLSACSFNWTLMGQRRYLFLRRRLARTTLASSHFHSVTLGLG